MEINELLTEGFEKWLQTLGYAQSTVYCSLLYVNDFFFYLKGKRIENLEQISRTTIKDYHHYLQTRKHKRRSGGLSENYIISNINALKRFSKYLRITEKALLEIDIQTRLIHLPKKTILSRGEIKALYQACANDPLGMRDRVMLDIYYGCGLRRSEGVSLDMKDVLLKQKLVYIKKGKGYRQRYVPVTGAIKENLQSYIQVAREELLNGKTEEALLVSYRATRMTGNSLMVRLNLLQKKAAIEKPIGLHVLRHSIATHLLQGGMSIEDVSRFLGHSSLESTQIYTHVANE